MRLEGIHHITCITGDARRNVDFYARGQLEMAWASVAISAAP